MPAAGCTPPPSTAEVLSLVWGQQSACRATRGHFRSQSKTLQERARKSPALCPQRDRGSPAAVTCPLQAPKAPTCRAPRWVLPRDPRGHHSLPAEPSLLGSPGDRAGSLQPEPGSAPRPWQGSAGARPFFQSLEPPRHPMEPAAGISQHRQTRHSALASAPANTSLKHTEITQPEADTG